MFLGVCRLLLNEYFANAYNHMSFSLLHIFVNVLADQLRHYSQNQFFRVQHVNAMTRHSAQDSDDEDNTLANSKKGLLPSQQAPKSVFRSQLFQSLLLVSTKFATRSIHHVKNSQSQALSATTTFNSTSITTTSSTTSASSSATSSAVGRLTEIEDWGTSNPFVLFFNAMDGQTISVLYR